MSKLPSMPLFPADFFTKTAHVDPDAAKAYMWLLMHSWMRGARLPNDDTVLARLACVSPKRWSFLKDEVMSFWTLGADGFWTQSRQIEEWNYTLEKVEKNRKNGSTGGKGSARKRLSDNSEIIGEKTNENNLGSQANASASLKHPDPYPYSESKDSSEVPPIPPQTSLLLDAPPVETPAVNQALQLWNDLASDIGLPKASILTDKRKTAIKARLRECGGIEGWKIALEKVAALPVLHGNNDRKWRISLDALSRQDTFTKLMEDGYANWRPTYENAQSSGSDAVSSAIDRVRQRISGDGSVDAG